MHELRVADLLADPILGTRIIAGRGGVNRAVAWAQTSEIPHPERWLGPHELLMTVGLSLPPDAAGQQALIRSLDEAGVAGMTVGDDGLAPELTPEMLAEADARNFPLLRTGPDTPFIVIARTVAAANSETQARGIMLLSRIYQLAGSQEITARRSGTEMSSLVGQQITVVDEATGCVVIGSEETRHAPPHRLNVAHPSGTEHPGHSLKTFRPTRLFLGEGRPMESLALVHLLQVLAVDTNAVLQDALRSVEQGESLLRALFAGGRDARSSVPEAWLPPSIPYLVVAFSPEAHPSIALTLALRGLAPLVTGAGKHSVLVATQGTIEAVRAVFSEAGAPAGVSAPHRDLGDLQGAVSEAVSEFAATAASTTTHPEWRLYEGWPVALLARSTSERENIVHEVLGPLADGSERSAVLRETLFELLDNELNQKLTAATLGVHPQSLAYRLRRIEELTGRSVRSPKGISELWIARNAWSG